MGQPLRIYLVIEAGANTSVAGNQTWRRSFHDTLVGMGHDVVVVPAEKGRRARDLKDSAIRSEFSRDVAERFRKEHRRKPFHLGFFYVMEGMIEEGAVAEIRRAGVPVCNFSCNNVHQFYLAGEIASWFDVNLYAEKEAGAKFRNIQATAMWWPMASNPCFFKPVDPVGVGPEVSFVGARYGTRLDGLHQLLLHGLEVRIYGPGWDLAENKVEPRWNWRGQLGRTYQVLREVWCGASKGSNSPEDGAREALDLAEERLHRLACLRFPNAFHGPVSDEEMIRLYSASKVSVGFLEVFDEHDRTKRRLQHLHLRDFEAPMCGAVYCTDYSDELAEMFEPGVEILACRGLAERIELIRGILADERGARRMRMAARRRALEEHTWEKRFEALFKHLGLGQ